MFLYRAMILLADSHDVSLVKSIIVNHSVKRLLVYYRVMTSYDARSSGISSVFTVASLQRLKMEALIPAPADCDVWSVIKFLNAQSIVPISIHRQLCQVCGL